MLRSTTSIQGFSIEAQFFENNPGTTYGGKRYLLAAVVPTLRR